MIKQRFIVVPLTDSAVEKLNYGVDYDNVEKLDFDVWRVSDEEFTEMWKVGIFQMLNEACNTIIDDYENERIELSNIDTALKVVNENNSINCNPVTRLKRMFEIAKIKGTFVEIDF